MKAVVQRVKYATLSVDEKIISQINTGLVVFFGVGQGDSPEKADYLAKKISALRIFEDENHKMNLSVQDVGGEILAVSQFTLYGDVSHGNRPGFSFSEKPELAKPIYERFMEALKNFGVAVKGGVFGADMQILQQNDGPVTILYDI